MALGSLRRFESSMINYKGTQEGRWNTSQIGTASKPTRGNRVCFRVNYVGLRVGRESLASIADRLVCAAWGIVGSIAGDLLLKTPSVPERANELLDKSDETKLIRLVYIDVARCQFPLFDSCSE